MPRRMATHNAGGYLAARPSSLSPPACRAHAIGGSCGYSPSFRHRGPTRFSTSGAELAQRIGFRTSGPPTP
eukprot:13136627-Alexandrium_andersonii.AAC.1